MAYEKTFAMLKPGVMQRRLAGEIISRIEKKGLQILGMKLMMIDRTLAETHYGEHREKSFFGELTKYITSGPVLAMVVGGESAISMIRTLCGATKADQAAPGTIRGDFALVTGMNIIHASDSPESAKREIGLFFKETEVLTYEDPNVRWIY